MAEALKHIYNQKFIEQLGQYMQQHHKAFKPEKFKQQIFENNNWQDKALKQRMHHIAFCLHAQLPSDYKTAITILKHVAVNFGGFESMFFPDYVETYGLDDFETSCDALAHFTLYGSAEFSVRAFILQDPTRMMLQMKNWAQSDNFHLRRLASEGCRPRLPWAIALPLFKKNPLPILTLIEILMRDSERYVQRSVANNLNDISKDNPDTVIDWTQHWLDKSKNINWILKHACRTLLKQGNPKALALFGYHATEHITIKQFSLTENVMMGDKLHFNFIAHSVDGFIGKCRLEFAIDFVKANGKLKRKVFKISESDYALKQKKVSKYFSFKKISTRKYYAGTHQLCIILNGIELKTASFLLTENG